MKWLKGLTFMTVLALLGSSFAQREQVEFWCWVELCAVGNEVKAEFEAQYPEYELVVTEMGPWDLHDRLLVSMAVGQGGPDVAQLVQRRFQQYVDTDKLLDISGDFSSLEEQFPEFLWDLVTQDGGVYGLPSDQAPGVLFYRSDLMAEAGVEMPIATWEEFVEIGQELTGDGRFMTWQFVPPGGWGVAYYVMFLHSRGGNIYDDDGQVIQNNELAADTLCWYKHLENISLQTEINSPDYFSALKANNLYTFANPPWGMLGIKQLAPELEGKWAVQPWPTWGEDGAATTGVWGGSVMTIPAQTDNPEGAKAFLEMVAASEYGGTVLWQVGNLLPAYAPALAYEGVHQPDPYLGGAVIYDTAIAPRTMPTFNYFNWAETEVLMGNQLDRMFADDLDCRTTWQNIESELTRNFN